MKVCLYACCGDWIYGYMITLVGKNSFRDFTAGKTVSHERTLIIFFEQNKWAQTMKDFLAHALLSMVSLDEYYFLSCCLLLQFFCVGFSCIHTQASLFDFLSRMTHTRTSQRPSTEATAAAAAAPATEMEAAPASGGEGLPAEAATEGMAVDSAAPAASTEA
jgi:hypothetical protein